ncbi:MAG: exodeoxyribonuclease VII small subunit [Dysgonamonadaceae bacterium]|jgi:exodeoxyribonuclease VII small subunit|nr:exodeoxyribonuclease VII small subunit [Dysgonamonadaceae bacterium]MDD3355769.1 exodeoxyribonuclease VII small subunit [Dysgonamonadaceae bacterium]MDD3727577.1 exodeoxyribonuclease VII small subunit [Dysgonamonadaceae bacterium]MDD4246469.1 exodeoxyribonuclease VII small subunit [Dysgonamonadaceae bacterium]MDD4606577.1 exodeoxyribonuclease VII small subunit [Dysgonamonadaceae bacterium]
MKNEEITYTEAKAEIEKIVALIESDELDVDELSTKVKRASELVAFCKQKLTETDTELQKILEELNA